MRLITNDTERKRSDFMRRKERIRMHILHTLNKKFWNGQLITFSEMERFVLETKSFLLLYDSFQIGNETNRFGYEMWK